MKPKDAHKLKAITPADIARLIQEQVRSHDDATPSTGFQPENSSWMHLPVP